MKVLVINEPFIKDFCRTQRWPAKTRARVLRPPEWLAYVTAVLEKSGVDTRLYDFPANDWDKGHLRELIKKEQPDFVVYDSTTPSIYSDIECAVIAKEVSSAKVIMAGTHASIFPKETLKDSNGAIDVIAIGEFDYTVRDIILNFNNLSMVKGICYSENGTQKLTVKRDVIENLDELPFPAWHQLDIMKYYTGMRLYPYLNIIGGRGCPFRCIFCQWPQVMHGHRYRFRSPANVVAEMEYELKLFPKLRKGEFFFEDDTFTASKSHAMALCEKMLEKNLNITFSVNARVDNYDREMFRMMKKAGCRVLWIGYESGDQGILDNIRKKTTIEQAKEFTAIAKEEGLHPHGCFVLGLPGETKETIKKTIKFALELKLPSLQFSAAVPYPGTEYYHNCQKAGLLRAKSWQDWLNQGEQSGVVDYPNLSVKEVNDAVDTALKKFYFRPVYMIKFLLSTRNVYDLYRKLKGAKNFMLYLINKYTGRKK